MQTHPDTVSGTPASAEAARGPHCDPSERVNLQEPRAVIAAIDAILRNRFGGGYGAGLLEAGVADLTRAFRGDYPGLLRCDTLYHDLHHALDSGLAMARLIDGQAGITPLGAPECIDGDHALLGVLLALYHDIGLLRRTEEAHLRGAQLTPVHEARGVEFMRDYLSRTALAHLAEKSALIMVTRLAWHLPAEMPALDRVIASMLGTADIFTQLADRAYLEKCRDFLFVEFSTFGLAGAPGALYPDARTLLEKTPGFYTDLLYPRIQLEYGGADRYLALHFGGACPYAARIARNIGYLNTVLAKNDLSLLRRIPRRLVDARAA